MKRICVFCGSAAGSRPEYRAAAEELGAELVRRKIGLVYGGGNVGLMGVLADAVLRAGGVAHGNDWAHGFMRGMKMRHDGWAELVNDEEHGGCLIPMMMLHHEHDEDPKMRPDPITPEKREQVITGMAAGLLMAYQYFRGQRGTAFRRERCQSVTQALMLWQRSSQDS